MLRWEATAEDAYEAAREWMDKLKANGTFHPYVWRECCATEEQENTA